MKRIINILKNNRAEGYIDTVISILVSTMVIVFALNVFSFLTIKQDMDYFAKEMIEAATVNGTTTGKTSDRYYELAEETGLTPACYWEAAYYNTSNRLVQLGDAITVTLEYETYLKGFGIFQIPVTLKAKHSGLSQKYWK